VTTIAVVPVQNLSAAKSRLAACLSSAKRRALVLDLLGVVLSALRESQRINGSIVVTPDPDVVEAAGGYDADGLLDNRVGLNDAIRLARNEVLRRGAGTLLIILGDLPLIRRAEIDRMLAISVESDVVVVPDRHGLGTNALVLRPPDVLEPCFGPGSLAAHRAAAHSKGLRIHEYRAPAAGFDLDVPNDLDDLARVEAGWMIGR
jgi:2-phospho-L-lactate/phosphoenolpyruvate guanylyltransferase